MQPHLRSRLLGLFVNTGFFAAGWALLQLIAFALGPHEPSASAFTLTIVLLPLGLAFAFAPLSAAAKGILEAKGYAGHFQPWSAYAIWAPLVFLGALLAPPLPRA